MDDPQLNEIHNTLIRIETLLERLVENTRPLTPAEILDREDAVEELREIQDVEAHRRMKLEGPREITPDDPFYIFRRRR